MKNPEQIERKEKVLMEKYMKDPESCPFCGSDNMTGGHAEFSFNQAYRDIKCCNCEKVWTEEFKMTYVTFNQNDL